MSLPPARAGPFRRPSRSAPGGSLGSSTRVPIRSATDGGTDSIRSYRRNQPRLPRRYPLVRKRLMQGSLRMIVQRFIMVRPPYSGGRAPRRPIADYAY